MMPIGKRLLNIRNDFMTTHRKRPAVARIHPRDYEDLVKWVKIQNLPQNTGMPQAKLDVNNLWGMKVVPDEKVTGVPVLELPKEDR